MELILQYVKTCLKQLLTQFITDVLLQNVHVSLLDVFRKSHFSYLPKLLFEFVCIVTTAKEGLHSPRRCLSASDSADIFAVKEGMTELLFAPENVKRKRSHMAGHAEREL